MVIVCLSILKIHISVKEVRLKNIIYNMETSCLSFMGSGGAEVATVLPATCTKYYLNK